jgi:DcuC family C4-dicarboxylate transporter
MSIGVMAAGLTSRGKIAELAAAFFEGAGYAYTHVISLIVAASTFAEGIRQSGLIGLLIRALQAWPTAAVVVATGSAWGLAFIAGTGIAPAVAIMEFFVPAAGAMGIDATRLGALTAIGAHFGRTMSPAAAVVVLSGKLADCQPAQLIRRVAVPLLVGGVVVLLAGLL